MQIDAITPPAYITSATFATIVSNFPAASYSGKVAFATDIGPRGSPVFSNGTNWRIQTGFAYASSAMNIVPGLSGATYSQTATTVTVTWTAHGMTSEFDGANCYLVQSTGALVSGWFTNWTYVDANTFTVTSSVSQTTSGNLGTNTSETFLPTSYTIPATAGFLVAGDNINLVGFTRNKNSANTKTTKAYYGNSVIFTGNATTSTNWVSASPSTLLYISSTKAIANGIALFAPADTVCKYSGTLTNSGDWMVVVFARVSLGPAT